MEGKHEGVLPLAAEVDREHGVVLDGGEEGKSEPVLPLGLALQLRSQALEELPELVLLLRLDAVEHVELQEAVLKLLYGANLKESWGRK